MTPSGDAVGTAGASPPVSPFDVPIGASGLPGAAALRRSGARLAITTVRDLVFSVPRRWIATGGHRSVAQMAQVAPGSLVTARLQLMGLQAAVVGRRRLYRTVARLADETGDTIEAVWFGRQYIERRIGPSGEWLLVAGKTGVDPRGRVSLQNPDFERESLVGAGQGTITGDGLVPVYRLTDGIRARTIRRAIRAALDAWAPYPEYLPAAVREAREPIGASVETIHFPADQAALDRALDRLAFDELLALQVGMVSRRRLREGDAAVRVPVSDERRDVAIATIQGVIGRQIASRSGDVPRAVALTPDQLAAVDAIRADLDSGRPMMRLVQGDVGSGKTAVAALAMAFVADAGGQAALLAPTDLLARQHAVTLTTLLEPLGHEVVLLTGSVGAAERREALALAAAPPGGSLLGTSRGRLFVGTQALIGEHIDFADLRLAIVDEQHRFGVADREALSAKGGSVHVLLMTATPIPQVIGQLIHADIEVSDLRAAPVGRLRVRTGIRRPNALDGTWDRVRSEAAAGRRAFVVVPLIEPEGTDEGGEDAADASDVLEGPVVPSAQEEAERLGVVLAPLRIGVVHGRQKPADRDRVMASFRDGELDVLVGTTVVEVGVDVPAATMMVIEGADRFGLAQLHQLRGRVGRGTDQSYCVLVTDAPEDSVAMERLRAVERTNDGFELAELDLTLRREGELLGLRQSGLPPLRVARLGEPRHRALSLEARAHAERLVGSDGRLHPGLEPLEEELTHGWLARVGAGEVLAVEDLDA